MAKQQIPIEDDWPAWKSDLADAINKAGLSMRAVSEAAGMGPTYVRDILKRDKEPGAMKLEAVWSVVSSGSPPRELAAKRVDDGEQIALFDVRAGMGGGGLVSVETYENGQPHEDTVAGYFGLPGVVSAGLRQPEKVYALPVTGDSMEPTLIGGSYVFVDTTHTNPTPADIYAVDYGDGLLVKRVELIPQSSKVRIISDNERYADHELERESVHVYGRVIAWFQWR